MSSLLNKINFNIWRGYIWKFIQINVWYKVIFTYVESKYVSQIDDIQFRNSNFKLFLKNSPWEMTQSDVVSREIYVKLAILKILHVTDIPRVKS